MTRQEALPANAERNINAFNADVKANGGYLYTTEARLSSQLANARLTRATLEARDFKGLSVIDIGCGDGSYTKELWQTGAPARMVGIDPAAEAIEIARRGAPAGVSFEVGGAYELPYADGEFDLAHLRGVLHHLNDPERAVQEALRVANAVLIIEPNGYNPVLKILEKVSPYHREHDEQSFPASRIDRWIARAGGVKLSGAWLGLVPFFAPDPLAKALKAMEPGFEAASWVARVSCAVYVVVARKPNA